MLLIWSCAKFQSACLVEKQERAKRNSSRDLMEWKFLLRHFEACSSLERARIVEKLCGMALGIDFSVLLIHLSLSWRLFQQSKAFRLAINFDYRN
jgi:hypothetical protein